MEHPFPALQTDGLNRRRQQIKSSAPQGFEIVWIKQGYGTFSVNGHCHRLADPSICFLYPGLLGDLRLEDTAEGYFLSFPANYLQEGEGHELFIDMDKYSDVPVVRMLHVEPELLMDMEELLQKIRRELHAAAGPRPDILRGLLKLFLAYFFHSLSPQQPQLAGRRDKGFVRRFLQMVKDHYKSRKQVAEYAAALCVTPSYLNQVVKRVTGFSARHHIQQYIISRAKSDALYSSLSMKEIAYGLGFSDDTHFSKFFKNISGTNFTSFRKAIAG
jgi:AraC-like DNA-binding protein